MTMRRHHFAFIADVLQEATSSDPNGWSISIGQARQIALVFATRLRTTNPNFNRERFLRACGVEQ